MTGDIRGLGSQELATTPDITVALFRFIALRTVNLARNGTRPLGCLPKCPLIRRDQQPFPHSRINSLSPNLSENRYKMTTTIVAFPDSAARHLARAAELRAF
jgi:hypothetical protein